MRAPSSVKLLSVVVAALALVSGCSPDEPDVVAVVPEPLTSEPELAPEPLGEAGPNQVILNGIRERMPPATGGAVQVDRAAVQVELQNSQASLSEVVPQTPLRLVFECAGGVTFAVQTNESQLVLFPPGFPPNGFLVLAQVRSASGMHYRASDIDFRSKGDLATLEMGRKRYVDCVANPAAAVWQETLPRITTPR